MRHRAPYQGLQPHDAAARQLAPYQGVQPHDAAVRQLAHHGSVDGAPNFAHGVILHRSADGTSNFKQHAIRQCSADGAPSFVQLGSLGGADGITNFAHHVIPHFSADGVPNFAHHVIRHCSTDGASNLEGREHGPLMAAVGAAARLALKRQPGPCELPEVLMGPAAGMPLAELPVPGACEEMQSSEALATNEAGELQEEPAARRRRLVDEPVVSPFFALRPYAQHKAAFVGRSLWCLDCFEAPGSAHRSWRHGRCGGAKPPMSMPPALRDCILRQPAACPKLQAGTRSRWTVLAGALGLH